MDEEEDREAHSIATGSADVHCCTLNSCNEIGNSSFNNLSALRNCFMSKYAAVCRSNVKYVLTEGDDRMATSYGFDFVYDVDKKVYISASCSCSVSAAKQSFKLPVNYTKHMLNDVLGPITLFATTEYAIDSAK